MCELRPVGRFLQVEGHNVAEILHKITNVPNFMTDSKLRKWCREFSEKSTDVHDERVKEESNRIA